VEGGVKFIKILKGVLAINVWEPVDYEDGNNMQLLKGRGKSISTVSEHRLDDRGSIPGRGKGSFL
jgi:hypothetical protein